MFTLQIELPEALSKQLDNLSKATGKKKKDVVREILEKELYNVTNIAKALTDMRSGKKTGKKIDISDLLADTEPYFKTVEDALKYSRGYE